MEQVMNQLLTQSASKPEDTTCNDALPKPVHPPIATNEDAGSSVSMQTNEDEDSNGDPSTASKLEERDAEMEDELADELAKTDAFSDYDIEITKEGEAIHEYLSLLDSSGK